MGNSIKMSPAVGGIAVRWENQNDQYQYYTDMGFIFSNYDSDVGVVVLVADEAGKWTELTVSFSTKYALLQPVLDSATRLYGAYAMDKWGHYSDTVFAWLKPVYEQWLDRRQMKEYYIGDDVRTIAAQADHPLGYWSAMFKLFDSIAFCFNPLNNSYNSSNNFHTGETDPATGEPYPKPFCFTMDLGITADVNRFWIALPTHSDMNGTRYYQFSYGSPYEFQLWGTTTDFGEGSPDYIAPDDQYWTEGKWKNDPRWRNMGRYLNKRPNAQSDTPGNYSTEPPTALGQDDAWDKDKKTREMGYGQRYLQNGSGPVKNNNFYFPDAGVHYAITEAAVGPVRYVRWEIHETWEQRNYVRFSELWYWGGIISENN
jgi:hypothetical protein